MDGDWSTSFEALGEMDFDWDGDSWSSFDRSWDDDYDDDRPRTQEEFRWIGPHRRR